MLRADTWNALRTYQVNKSDYPVINTPDNPNVVTGTELTQLVLNLIDSIAQFTECHAEDRDECTLGVGDTYRQNPTYHRTLEDNRPEFIALLRNYERVLRELFGFTVYNTCGSSIFPGITPATSWVNYVTSVTPSGSPGTTDPEILLERVVRLDAHNVGLNLANDVHEQPQMLLCEGLLYRNNLEGIRKAAELIWSDIRFGTADLQTNRVNPDLFEYHVRSINSDGSLIAVARCYIGPQVGNFNVQPYSAAIYRWADGTYYNTLFGYAGYSSCQLAVEGLGPDGWSMDIAFQQEYGIGNDQLTDYDYGEHRATTQTYGIDTLPRRLGLK